MSAYKHIELLNDKAIIRIHTNKGYIDIDENLLTVGNSIDRIIGRVDSFYNELCLPPNIKEIREELEQVLKEIKEYL